MTRTRDTHLQWRVCLAVIFATVNAGVGGEVLAERDSTDAERVIEYAKSKFAHFVTEIDPADPLGEYLPMIFCRDVVQLQLPDLCGRPTSLSKVYFVDVLTLSHTRVFDVIALSKERQPFSLLDGNGMRAWVQQEQLDCSSKEEFLSLVQTHLRFIYKPRQSDWTPLQICNAFGPAEVQGTCQPPEVVELESGFATNLRVQIQPGEREDSWANWRFTLTEEGYRGQRGISRTATFETRDDTSDLGDVKGVLRSTVTIAVGAHPKP